MKFIIHTYNYSVEYVTLVAYSVNAIVAYSYFRFSGF